MLRSTFNAFWTGMAMCLDVAIVAINLSFFSKKKVKPDKKKDDSEYDPS